MRPHDLAALDWPRVCERVAETARSAPARQALLATPPAAAERAHRRLES